MSTLTQAGPFPGGGVAAPPDRRPPDRRPAVARLLRVELRKAVDTRAGAWLLLSTVLLGVVVVVLRMLFGAQADKTLASTYALALVPTNVLLPVIGILLVTSEWSQRTALVTFSLVPHRGRVVGAKLLAMGVLAAAATAAALVTTLAGFAVGAAAGVTAGGWRLTAVQLAQTLLAQELSMVMGAVFGLILLNSAAAIVLSFALPMAWNILGSLIASLHSAAAWLDTGRTLQPLFEANGLTGRQWNQLAVSLAVWLVLPMIVGLVRLRRKEIA